MVIYATLIKIIKCYDSDHVAVQLPGDPHGPGASLPAGPPGSDAAEHQGGLLDRAARGQARGHHDHVAAPRHPQQSPQQHGP